MRRGSSIRLTAFAAGAIFCLAALSASASSEVAGPRANSGATARQCGYFVGGKKTCLRVGQRCKPADRRAYLVAGFACSSRKGRYVLVRASESALRRGEPIRLEANGRPTFTRALQAFDLLTPLPGVETRRGAVVASADATLAVNWLYGYRNQLTPAQRAVLNRVITPNLSPKAMPDAAGDQWRDAVAAAKTKLTDRWGLKFVHHITTGLKPLERAYAFAVPEWRYGSGQDCALYLTPEGQSAFAAEGLTTAVHELIHCAEAEFAPFGPGWVVEGLAAWAESPVILDWVGAISKSTKGYWRRGIHGSDADLFRREYTAIAFWGLLAHEGQSPFALMGPVMRAGNNAYSVVTRGKLADLEQRWGSTLASTPAEGELWDLFAPANPIRGPLNENVPVRNGAKHSIPLPPRSGWAMSLNVSADVVTIRLAGATGYFKPNGGSDIPLQGEKSFCTRPEGCSCAGQELGLDQIEEGKALVGFATARARAASGTVLGESQAGYCKRKGKPKKRPVPGIEVWGPGPDPNVAVLLATFKSGRCTKTGGRFTATSTVGGMQLQLRIDDYVGPNIEGGIYFVDYGAPVRRIDFSGTPGGPYSTTVVPYGVFTGGAAVINFPIVKGRRTDAQVGSYNLPGTPGIRNADSSEAILVRGVMLCRY